jgi:hypothetical protein
MASRQRIEVEEEEGQFVVERKSGRAVRNNMGDQIARQGMVPSPFMDSEPVIEAGGTSPTSSRK